jgi:hypothetical protein
MIKDHSQYGATESQYLIQKRAIRPYKVICGIQTYIDYLHQNLLFFAPEGRINFGMGDVAGLTQTACNYATMLKIPQTPPTFTMSYLVVAGGGGAGAGSANALQAGGGAGGLLTGSLSWASGITFVATIGVGGPIGTSDGDADQAGSNGGNSSLVYSGNTILSYGGGGGGTFDNVAKNGGSGGGQGDVGSFGLGILNQGFNGGTILSGTGCGGGGGAGGLGGNAYYDENSDSNISGDGGIGLSSSLVGYPYVYACGGAGRGGDGDGALPSGYGDLGCGGSAVDTDLKGDGHAGGVFLSVPTSKYTGIVTGGPIVSRKGANTTIFWLDNSGTYIS